VVEQLGVEWLGPARGGATMVVAGAGRSWSGRGGGGPRLGLRLEMEFLCRGGCEVMETHPVI
jgi:hypothetical protein